MKIKYLYTLIFILILSINESYGHNFIKTITATSPNGNGLETVQFYNALGQPNEKKIRYKGGNGKDLLCLTTYNSRNLLEREWLMLPIFHNDLPVYIYPESAQDLITDYYGEKEVPYSLQMYEASPLARPIREFGVGNQWCSNGKSIELSYSANGVEYPCCLFVTTDNRSEVQFGATQFYPDGELFVTQAKDEDGKINIEFKDKQGQKIMIRQKNKEEIIDTYFVYDSYGNLRAVFPPLAADVLVNNPNFNETHEAVNKYAYLYKYDAYNRCIAKKIPGCDWIYFIYDQADRLIFSQDGNQRNMDIPQWTFYLYDNFQRLIVEGLCSNQNISDISTQIVKSTLTNTQGIGHSGYTTNIELIDAVVNIVNYYDTYDFLSRDGFDTKHFPSSTINAKGSLTGTIKKILGADTIPPLFQAIYYDIRGQVINEVTNRSGWYDIVHTEYTYTGKPLKICIEHLHDVKHTEEYNYSYDLAERILQVNYQLDSLPSVILSKQSYDDLGKLIKKTSHNNALCQEYSYNIRNWITKITSPHFSQNLYYADNLGIPCYNGNISAMTWSTDSILTRGYKFEYDELNRLKNALYGEGNNLSSNSNHFNEQVDSYDKHGNILKLQRNGQISNNNYGVIDRLTMDYNGNQLEAIKDNATDSAYKNGFEFKDEVDLPTEYSYDANGNLIQDLNKKITDIQYNCINLPSQIQFEDGSMISYLYDADGTKLSTKYKLNEVISTSDYFGNAIYENGILRALLTEEGYITLTDTVYHYFLKDYQGNNRMIVDQNKNIEEVNHYYPFGGIFTLSTSVQPYKYNGKELEMKKGLNWYDYGARMYDPAIGKFMKSDRFSENYYALSNYQYGANNPVNIIDINGDSLLLNKSSAAEVILAIYNGLEGGKDVKMKFNNGVLDPSSIQEQAENSSDFFLKDLYEIASSKTMVELSISDVNTYKMNGKKVDENFVAPYEYDTSEYGPEYEKLVKIGGGMLGKNVDGDLGQTLIPGNKTASGKSSMNNNIQITINKKGTLNHRTTGIAHEFGHVILYLRGLPFGHRQPGVDKFVYDKNDKMLKRLGYGK